MKKKVIIPVAIIAAVAIVVFMIYWNNPQTVYHRELSKIHTLVDEGKTDESIRSALKRTAAGGDWGKLERAVKDYIMIRRDTISALNSAQSDRDIDDALSADVIKSNMSDFSSQIKKLETANSELKAAREQFQRIKTIDDAVEYYKDSIPGDLMDEFKADVDGDFGDKSMWSDVDSGFKITIGMTEIYHEALEYLAAHSDGWNVDNDALNFTNNSVEKEYQSILEKVAEIK